MDVSAPGEALITTYPGGHYAAAWGTSFSAALVAGGMALFHQLLPAIDEDDAVMLMRQETVPIYLAGARIDLYEALEELIERRPPQ